MKNIFQSILKFITTYKKIIFIALILVSVVICVFATYITEYNKTKVNPEELLTSTYEYKDSEEFLENFNSFVIYSSKSDKAYMDGDTIKKGTEEFKILVQLKDGSDVSDSMTVKLALAADWISFKTSPAQRNITIDGKEETIKITNIDQIFPATGKLWFTKVNHPTLYVLVEWNEFSQYYYTRLEFSYDQYSKKPIA